MPAATLPALANLQNLLPFPTQPAVPVKEALLRTIAESENRGMRSLSTALLAGLDGVGPLLVQHPASLAVVLRCLQAAAPAADAAAGERPEAKRARTEAAGEAETPRAAAAHAAEEVEADWALCSALARALASPQAPARVAEEGAEEPAVGPAAEPAAAVGLLAEHVGVLCADWAASGASLSRHQAYVLRLVAPLLAPCLDEAAAAALQAAAERCGAAAQ